MRQLHRPLRRRTRSGRERPRLRRRVRRAGRQRKRPRRTSREQRGRDGRGNTCAARPSKHSHTGVWQQRQRRRGGTDQWATGYRAQPGGSAREATTAPAGDASETGQAAAADRGRPEKAAAQAYTHDKPSAEHHQQDADERRADACGHGGGQASDSKAREMAAVAPCMYASSVAACEGRGAKETRQACTGMGRRAGRTDSAGRHRRSRQQQHDERGGHVGDGTARAAHGHSGSTRHTNK